MQQHCGYNQRAKEGEERIKPQGRHGCITYALQSTCENVCYVVVSTNKSWTNSIDPGSFNLN